MDLSRMQGSSQPALFVQGAVLSCLYLLVYSPLFPGLAREWYEHPSFSYGFLIPLIALYLVWERREVLRALPVEPNPWASLSLLGAVLIGLLGKAIGDLFIMRVAMVLALGGLAHLLLGRRFIKALLFPIAYLLLMIPAPYAFIKTLSYHLRLFDAVLAAEMLQFIGIPVYRDSYFLQLPGMLLEVADVCSGVSSLFTLFALGALYAYFLPLGAGARMAVLFSTLPFAVVVNLLRIVLTCALAYYFGPAMLQASFHAFSGTLTFLFSLFLVIVLGEFLRRKTGAAKGRKERANSLEPAGAQVGLFSHSFMLAVLILGLTYGLVALLERGRPVELRGDLRAAASGVGAYALTPDKWEDAYEDSNAERAVSQLYRAPDGGLVELYVGFRGRQRAENRLRSPRLHFPEGWNYGAVESRAVSVPGGLIHASSMVTQKGGARRLVLFWYQTQDKTFGSEIGFRTQLIRNSVLSGRTDGAVVRVATRIPEGETVEKGQTRLLEFVQALYSRLVRILPA
ncbi:MAG: exosortase C-terminal domain/associated protein EpsI [Candidatus Binatia bacterium]